MHIIISEKKKKKRFYVMTTFKFQTKEKRKDTYRERLLIPFALTSLYINKNMYSQFIKY